jgi:hypothetical protein
MVEYAVGIGAVLCVCLMVLGGLGFSSQDTMQATLININDPSINEQNPSPGADAGGIFKNGIDARPWLLQ